MSDLLARHGGGFGARVRLGDGAEAVERQVALLERGGVITQETRDYDGTTGTSQSLRSKEEAHDYRYFPDPDLMPVQMDRARVAELEAELHQVRTHYNTVRLHAGIGYVTPDWVPLSVCQAAAAGSR